MLFSDFWNEIRVRQTHKSEETRFLKKILAMPETVPNNRCLKVNKIYGFGFLRKILIKPKIRIFFGPKIDTFELSSLNLFIVFLKFYRIMKGTLMLLFWSFKENSCYTQDAVNKSFWAQTHHF